MSANRHRHCIRLAKIWLWIRSECPKVPIIRRNDKNVSTKNYNIRY